MIDVVDELASRLKGLPALDLYSVEEILKPLRDAYWAKDS